MDLTTAEERIIELETRFVYQERTIDELNEVVRKQQDQIDILLQKMKDLTRQIQSNITPDEPGVRPPHY